MPVRVWVLGRPVVPLGSRLPFTVACFIPYFAKPRTAIPTSQSLLLAALTDKTALIECFTVVYIRDPQMVEFCYEFVKHSLCNQVSIIYQHVNTWILKLYYHKSFVCGLNNYLPNAKFVCNLIWKIWCDFPSQVKLFNPGKRKLLKTLCQVFFVSGSVNFCIALQKTWLLT